MTLVWNTPACLERLVSLTQGHFVGVARTPSIIGALAQRNTVALDPYSQVASPYRLCEVLPALCKQGKQAALNPFSKIPFQAASDGSRQTALKRRSLVNITGCDAVLFVPMKDLNNSLKAPSAALKPSAHLLPLLLRTKQRNTDKIYFLTAFRAVFEDAQAVLCALESRSIRRLQSRCLF